MLSAFDGTADTDFFSEYLSPAEHARRRYRATRSTEVQHCQHCKQPIIGRHRSAKNCLDCAVLSMQHYKPRRRCRIYPRAPSDSSLRCSQAPDEHSGMLPGLATLDIGDTGFTNRRCLVCGSRMMVR